MVVKRMTDKEVAAAIYDSCVDDLIKSREYSDGSITIIVRTGQKYHISAGTLEKKRMKMQPPPKPRAKAKTAKPSKRKTKPKAKPKVTAATSDGKVMPKYAPKVVPAVEK